MSVITAINEAQTLKHKFGFRTELKMPLNSCNL